jgi:hypothetical protein
LSEATVQDVIDWLRLLAVQPEAEVWQLKQADRALRVMYPGNSTRSANGGHSENCCRPSEKYCFIGVDWLASLSSMRRTPAHAKNFTVQAADEPHR